MFENFVLDTDRRELSRAAGPVRLEPQVFDLLEYLIKNRDRVVTRDDLFASIWKGRFVSDATLSSRISAARSAIGDSGEHQRLIRTLSRKGLRFIANVQEELGVPQSRPNIVSGPPGAGQILKTAAIMAADVERRSFLTAAERERTLARLRTLRSDFLDPIIAQYRGRNVQHAGDEAIAVFPSAMDAVRCACKVQAGMLERNVGLPDDRRIEFRIGIHIGDVAEEIDGSLVGDTVNVAIGLEHMCQNGRVCLSEETYRRVSDRLDDEFEDLGEQRVGAIARPMRVFGLHVGSKQPGSDAAAASGILAPPARPSIAVLPFQNMSGDPEQDYFADGIVEDITTQLSQVKWLFVISRNSSFTYKGRAVDIRQIGRELGVRYVVEGSVRKSGDRMRITGQLIKTGTGEHIWADSFDGEITDVFDLQDRVSASIVAAIEPSLRRAEIERARSKPTARLDAYDYYLRALPHFYALNQEGVDRAIALLQQAVAIDANFALAKAYIARCYAWCDPQGWASGAAQEREMAIRLSREALQIGSDDPAVLWMAGFVLWQLRVDPEGAIELYERSLAINANCVQALTLRGWALATVGRSSEALPSLLQALRLSPLDPEAFFTMSALGCALMLAGQFDEALKWTTRALRERPAFAPALRFHAVCQVELGRSREAHETVEHLLQLEPGLNLTALSRRAPIFDENLMNAFLGGLRKAGLPE